MGLESLEAEVRDAFLQGTGVEDANMPTLNLMVCVAEFPANPFREKARHACRKQSARFNDAANFKEEGLVVVDML